MSLDAFAKGLENEIRRDAPKYSERYGWRFLYSPVDVLDGAKAAFIGLNPGGTGEGEKLDNFAMPSGQSAYRDEIWSKQSDHGTAPLQVQAKRIFKFLDIPSHEVLAGNIVPFRTPKWADLSPELRKNGLDLGASLWSRILSRAKPSIIVSVGRDAGTAMSEICGVPLVEKFESGWGKIKVRRGRKDDMTIVGLPHLSRFRIFSRADHRDVLQRVFGDLT